MNPSKLKSRDVEQAIILIVTAIGLFGLLSYTFWHTGGLLSRFVNPGFLGYTAAFGIEAIIVVMSYKLAKLKSNSQTNWWLWFALAFALVVSAVANYAEGFYTYHEQLLTWVSWWSNVDPVQFIISLLATALISVLVFVVSDIISTDVTPVIRKVEHVIRSPEQPEQPEQQAEQVKPVVLPQVEHTNSKEVEVHQAIQHLVNQGEQLTTRAIAEEAKCGIGTANKWMATYKNGTH